MSPVVIFVKGAWASAGGSVSNSMAMIARTTRSSTKVKDSRERERKDDGRGLRVAARVKTSDDCAAERNVSINFITFLVIFVTIRFCVNLYCVELSLGWSLLADAPQSS